MEKAEKIKILQDLIQIKSVNGNEIEISEYLSKLLKKHGIDSKIFPFDDGRANLIAELGTGESDQVLALEGHQDTVVVAHPENWKRDPFKGEIVGDKIYGRGAADMKSGLASEVIALCELADKGQVPNGKIRLIATSGEEFGAPGAYKIESKYIDDVDAMIVGEPSDGDVTYAHSGSLNYQITSTGKPAHSSTPDLRLNAITGLVKYIQAEPRLFDDLPVDPVLGKVQHSITVINGGEQVNIIPGSASLLGNVRPTPSFNNDNVIELIQTAVDKINDKTPYHLEFKLIHNFYPIETDKNNSFVQDAYQVTKKDYHNHDSELIVNNGATDASVYVQENDQMAVILLGPDKNNTSHQINEYTTLSSYLDTIDAYQDIANDFFAKK